MTAQEVYTNTVSQMDEKEQARLVSMIIDRLPFSEAAPSRPDRFFTQTMIDRLQYLMERTHQGTLTPDEQIERDQLVGAEVMASMFRASVLMDAMGK
jgi:hypothetical protein